MKKENEVAEISTDSASSSSQEESGVLKFETFLLGIQLYCVILQNFHVVSFVRHAISLDLLI